LVHDNPQIPNPCFCIILVQLQAKSGELPVQVVVLKLSRTVSQENDGTISEPRPQRNRVSDVSAEGVATVNEKISAPSELVDPISASQKTEQFCGSFGRFGLSVSGLIRLLI